MPATARQGDRGQSSDSPGYLRRFTYCFDTVKETWSEGAGDWVLPFSRDAVYVPEHRLWFGISPIEDGFRFCASNLDEDDKKETMLLSSPPVVHGAWQEYAQPPPEWSLSWSYALHLGSSSLFIVRFFDIGKEI